MNHLKRTSFWSAMLLLSVFTLSLLSSCDSSSTNPETAVHFKFVINNHTSTVYNVYMNSSAGGTSYSNIGKVYASSSFTKENLVVGDTYTFRLVEQGGSVDNPAHEKKIKGTNSNTITWNVN